MTDKKNKTNKNKNTKQTHEIVDIRVPKKLEREVKVLNSRAPSSDSFGSSTTQGLNVRSSSRKTREHFEIRSGGNFDRPIRVGGHCMLSTIDLDTRFPDTGGSSNTYVLSRMMVHPKNFPSSRLKQMASLYAKYKFTKFIISYYTAKNATVDGSIMVSFLDNYEPTEPNPGTSTRAWCSEMDCCGIIKVWEDGYVTRERSRKDKSSYFLDQTNDDIYDIYQSQVLIIANGLTKGTYYGDLYIDYEIEFSEPYVPPVNYDYGRSYVLPSSSTAIAKGAPITWVDNTSSTVASWTPFEGLWLCTLNEDSSTNFLSESVEYANHSFYGTSFILSVEGDATSSIISTYDAIRFTIYSSMAAVLAASPLQARVEFSPNATYVSLSKLLDTNPTTATSLPWRDSLTVSKNDNQKPLGIGISVGPGIIAGEPDVYPHLDLSHGRFVCPSPYSRR